jgi:hypothetical protein
MRGYPDKAATSSPVELDEEMLDLVAGGAKPSFDPNG